MALEYIFVYGTLRKKSATKIHYLLARHCEYCSEGYMRGKLYEVGGYPGAIESDGIGDKVHGELYTIVSSGEVLPQLDEYEACTDKFPEPHEFIRKKLPVNLAGGDEVTAWVYVFNHDVSSLPHIESGDYASYINAEKLQ